MSSDDIKTAEYMGERMLAYFREKLITLRSALLNQGKVVKDVLSRCANSYEADDIIMSTQKRNLLLSEIDDAIERIEQGVYGYCEETGDEIGFGRLDLEPTARYCVDVQERLDKKNRFLKSSGSVNNEEG
ncbi:MULTISPECIES: TraR/DksA family transcriptional regulator [Neorickettsia]|uniref:TraR/DksA family transcriptional regulator n=1 Tax=Neorickettsia findlayensis TaxID=2686014 RepID=A0A6P1G9J3_9RICK|nr:MULTISPECIES: TraR/DksA family transcriptional regulator [Neorickettsia]KYH12308.1 molecular chaperone DnaK [Neorickettsia sp. 179522]QHD64968.1 TraR/DksA family transcriptional regulator [Neorickettsia findlayensis]